MDRRIPGFHQDEESFWVAELECGHQQHVRHNPPMTLRKTWALPDNGPNNFKVKPKLNKKMNIRFGKEALELADRVLMGSGGKKIDEYLLREALGRQKRLCVGFN
jgi:hypothetical protein